MTDSLTLRASDPTLPARLQAIVNRLDAGATLEEAFDCAESVEPHKSIMRVKDRDNDTWYRLLDGSWSLASDSVEGRPYWHVVASYGPISMIQ